MALTEINHSWYEEIFSRLDLRWIFWKRNHNSQILPSSFLEWKNYAFLRVDRGLHYCTIFPNNGGQNFFFLREHALTEQVASRQSISRCFNKKYLLETMVSKAMVSRTKINFYRGRQKDHHRFWSLFSLKLVAETIRKNRFW